jgi:hypothetical protein
MEARGSLYLEGYWQSEKYFADIGEQLRNELTLKAPPDAQNAETIAAIENCNAVCLHVRRGDYVAEPDINAVHGTCDADYYQRAVAAVANRVADPVFFVFSDDPDWCATRLRVPYPVNLITHNVRSQDHEDLRLMTHCKHFILANSSFSWWGAWLASRPEKTVICPKRWFARADVPTDDLIPSTWTRL